MKRNELNKLLHEIYSSLKRYIVGDYSESMHASVVNKQKIALEMQSNILIYSAIPRYLIEAVGLIVILIYFYFLSIIGISGEDILAIMVTFVFSFQRLLPAVNSVYFSWSNIVGTHKQTEEIVNFLEFTEKYKINRINSYPVFKSVDFKNISYQIDAKDIFIENLNIKLGEIQFIKGNSLDVLPTLKKKFDLFHIDGNHKNSIATKEFLHCINLRKNNNFKVIFDDVRTCEPLKNNIVKNFTIKLLKEADCGSKNCFINIEFKNDTIKKQIKEFNLDYLKFFILTLPLRSVKIIPVKLIPFKFILPRKIINFVKYL
jgi:hypothetical protein